MAKTFKQLREEASGESIGSLASKLDFHVRRSQEYEGKGMHKLKNFHLGKASELRDKILKLQGRK